MSGDARPATPCPLCDAAGGAILWKDAFCRVVHADEPDYPGFLRVILNRHVREMTDLPPEERLRLMAVVYGAEQAVRDVLNPDKVNLASLGNVVPHLHWHVIPRFADDPHFPNPVWGSRLRDRPHAGPSGLAGQLSDALSRTLNT